MDLKEILNKIIEKQLPVVLCNSNGNFSASELLKNLSETKLRTKAYYQTGLYIAKISESGFLGDVLFKLEKG